MPITPFLGRPGMGTLIQAAHRAIFSAKMGERYLPGGALISGAASADPGNTGDVRKLRAGTVMGKITASGKYAPSIIGVAGEAMTSSETDLTVSEAVGDEIERRIGASGTFKLIGPPTAAGTVRTKTVTYSGIAAAGGGNRVITITAMGISDVWTLTAPAGQDAGFYQLEVTTGKGTSAEVTAVTAALAANANTATVDAALEALTNVGAGGVAAVYSDPTLTLTFSADLGPVYVRVLSDTTNDGGVFEGGWAAVHTTTGVDGRFVAGSFICPTDGSETPITFLPDGYPMQVYYDGVNYDVDFPSLPIAGTVNSSQLVNWPSDTSLQAWLIAALKTNCPYVFDSAF